MHFLPSTPDSASSACSRARTCAAGNRSSRSRLPLGLPVEERPELAEGVGEAEIWAFVEELAGSTAVLCTHGDILGLLLGEEPEKGSTWVVEVDPGGGLSRLTYLPPPA